MKDPDIDKPTVAIWRGTAAVWAIRIALVHVAIVLLTAGDWDDVLPILLAWGVLIGLLGPGAADRVRIDEYRRRKAGRAADLSR